MPGEQESKSPERRALAVSVSRFSDVPLGEEPSAGALADLPFAATSSREVQTALATLGYHCEAVEDQTAEALGAEVLRWLGAGQEAGGVQVVHVIGHGVEAAASRELRMVGRDGRVDETTSLYRWLVKASDDLGPTNTLFLLDLCGAGGLAIVNWDMTSSAARRRAWVVAGCEPGTAAFNGRFSQAVAEVLRRAADGSLDDIDPSVRFIPLEKVAQEIALEVLRRAAAEHGRPQRVVGSRVDLAERLPSLPFFPNLAFRDNRGGRGADVRVDVAVQPYVDVVDALVDPLHFIFRARGLPAGAADARSCFTGRRDDVAALSAWLDGRDSGNLRVVTGSPGVGKSALLGLLVCAAHPQLRASSAWHVVEVAPSRNDHFAAVHVRHRDVPEVLASLTRQLGLEPEAAGQVDTFVSALAHRKVQPVLVVDALDEAVAPVAMHALLIAMTQARRRDGGPACRLLVGARPWEEFRPLIELADSGLVDLDQVDRDQLRVDLTSYVDKLLQASEPYAGADRYDVRRAVAGTVAAVLSQAPAAAGSDRWGEFLVAGLFVNYLVDRPAPITDPARAAALAARVPLSLPDVFELDLDVRVSTSGWLRPALTATAHAHGDGMPASVIAAVAPAFAAGVDGDLDAAAVAEALDEARFYLRTTVDRDGTTLYRLFHQGLAEHLRARAVGRQERVWQRLLDTVPASSDGRRWDLARPYLLRHAAAHAVEAGRLDDLLVDLDFVVYAEPSSLARYLHGAEASTAKDVATIYRTSYLRHLRVPPERRRDLLVVDAARHGRPELQDRWNRQPDRPSRGWRARWVTGAGATPALRHILVGHTSAVDGVTTAPLPGSGAVAVTTSDDGTARTWNLTTGEMLRSIGGVPSGSSPALIIRSDDGPLAVIPTAEGLIWDVLTGESLLRGDNEWWSRVDTVLVDAEGNLLLRWRTGDAFGVQSLNVSLSARHEWQLLRAGTGALMPAPWVPTAKGRVFATRGGFAALSWLSDDDHDPPQLRLHLPDSTGPREVVRAWYAHLVAERVPSADDPAAAAPVVVIAAPGRPALAVHPLTRAKVELEDFPTAGRSQGSMTVGYGGDGTPFGFVTAAGRLFCWNLLDGSRNATIGGISKVTGIRCVTVAGAPMALVARGRDGVAFCDLQRGVVMHELIGHDGAVTNLSVVQPDDGPPLAVTASADATARVWDLRSALETRPVGHTRTLTSAARASAAATGPIVATGSSDGTARIWNAADGRQLHILPHSDSTVSDVAYTLDAQGQVMLVTGTSDGRLTLWDPVGGAQLRQVTLGGGWMSRVACTSQHDGGVTAVAATDAGTLYLWHAERDGSLTPLHGHVGPVLDVACTLLSDGTPAAVTVGGDGTVRIWDLATATCRRTFDHHGRAVRRVACVPTRAFGPLALTLGLDGAVRTWRLDDGRPHRQILEPGFGAIKEFARVTGTGDRPQLVTATMRNVVRLRDLFTGDLLFNSGPHESIVTRVAGVPLPGGGTAVVSATSDAKLHVFDERSGWGRTDIQLPDEAAVLLPVGEGQLVVACGREVAALDLDR